MCLILFAYDVHESYRLVLAANRDEYYARPSLPMAWWGQKQILSGLDERAGGTWFGLDRQSRWSAVTNYRGQQCNPDQADSRGGLPVNFLKGDSLAEDYLGGVQSRADRYRGFNLLVGDHSGVFYFSNRDNESTWRKLTPGVYGLSNDLLNVPWPKVELGKSRLEKIVKSNDQLTVHQLFDVLDDKNRPDDQLLPNTGVGMEMERLLGPMFIESDDYGTRCSSGILISQAGKTEVAEKTFPTCEVLTYQL